MADEKTSMNIKILAAKKAAEISRTGSIEVGTPTHEAKVKVAGRYSNTSQEFIEITSDKVQIILTKHEKGYRYKEFGWALASTLLTIMLTILTSDFKDALGLEAKQWKTVFCFIALLSFILMAICIYNVFKKGITIDNVIEEMKKGRT